MRKQSGFTLIELLAVIAIIAMMSAMLFPHIGKIQERAQSIVCVNNLREIGVGVLSYVGEHDNEYPIVEPRPEDPVYTYTDEESVEMRAQPLIDALGPYGVTDSVLKCPTDMKKNADSWYAKNDPHTSYLWRVMLDGENANAPKIYGGRRGYGVRIVKPGRVTICTDFDAIHSNKMNRLYADGHVSKPN